MRSGPLASMPRPSVLVGLLAAIGMTFYFAHSHQGHLRQSYFAAFVVGGLASVVPHEVGHALVAWATGSRVITIRIGSALFGRTSHLPVGGFRLELAPSRSLLAGNTRFSPVPGPAGLAVTLLAGSVFGAGALAGAAFAVHSSAPRDGLITAVAFHVLANLVPNRAGGRRNDGTQLLGLAGRSRRGALRAIRIAEQEVPAASVSEGTVQDPGRVLEVLGRACTKPWLSAKAREELQAQRGAALWLAGRFLESAQAFENLKHGRDGWADSLCTAALFGQIDRDESLIASVAEAVEQRARNDRSIAAAHTLAVLRLVQGRPAGAWLALSTHAAKGLAPAYRVAVVATQALAAPDSSRRAQLFQEAREIDPSSVWTSLENASPIQDPAPEMTTPQTAE